MKKEKTFVLIVSIYLLVGKYKELHCCLGPRFQEILWSKVRDESFFRNKKYVKHCLFLGWCTIPMDTGTFKDSIIVKLLILIKIILGVLLTSKFLIILSSTTSQGN